MVRESVQKRTFDEFEPGTRYAGRFTIEELRSAGPLGDVYRARSAEGLVALRVFRPDLTDLPGLTDYLRSVAKKIDSCKHAGLNIFHRLGVSAGQIHVAEAYLSGGSLADRLVAEKRLNLEEGLRLIAAISPPLSALHASRIIHGNLKPANINFDGSGTPLLTHARIPAVIEQAVRTLDLNVPLDVPLHIAPEIIGGRENDARSDQFSMAAILYNLLVGELPFPAKSLEELNHLQFTQSAPQAHRANPDIPLEVSTAIGKALGFALEQRFESLQDFLTALGVSSPTPLIVPAAPKTKPQDAAPEAAASVEAAPVQAEKISLPELDVEKRFGRFDLHELIGKTDLNLVYRAVDRAARKDVALKLLADNFMELPQFEKYFLNVVNRFNEVEHPYLVPLLRAGKIQGRLFYSVGLLRGGTLADRLEAGALPIQDALAILSNIGPALSFLHQHDFVHLNLKPSNILFDENGHAWLSEVGLAPMIATAAASFASSDQRGVFDYQAPELIAGRSRDRTLDARSYVYSLGCLMFGMLIGRPPYHGDTPRELAETQFSQPVPAARVLRPEVDLELDEALRVAMSFNRAGRFESVAEFMAAITGAVPAPLPKSDVIPASGRAAARPTDTLEILHELAPELAAAGELATVSQKQLDALMEARRARATAVDVPTIAPPTVPAVAPIVAPVAVPARVTTRKFILWALFGGLALLAVGLIFGAGNIMGNTNDSDIETPEVANVALVQTEEIEDEESDSTETTSIIVTEIPTVIELPPTVAPPTPFPPTALPTMDPLSSNDAAISEEALDGVLSNREGSTGISGSALVDPNSVPADVVLVMKQIVELLNQQRDLNGFPPLVTDIPLNSAAQTRTQDMVTRRYFSHYDPATEEALVFPLAASVGFNQGTYVGENIGRTTLSLLTAGPSLVIAWMESPTHRANVLRGEFDFIGVGMQFDEISNTWFATTLFASRFAVRNSGG